MSTGIARACLNRYQDFANNVSFMDGHVESVKLPDLWTLKWHRHWKTPANLPELPKQ
jgi:prepilin-type processing-associated H-X9-DG protein